MATIYISKQKVRRGTNDQRLHTIFDQGELVSTTDTKRLYVGNGVLSGGNSVSAKIHPPLTLFNSLSNVVAEVGDLVTVRSIWYQLTAAPYSNISNWGDMRTKVSAEFEYDSTSTLNVKLSGLSASKLNPRTLTNGIHIVGDKLQLNYKTNFFEISSNQLSLKNGGVTQRELLSSSFGNGLSGGNGNIIGLNVDSSNFTFDGGVLTANYDTLSAYGLNNQVHLPLSSYYGLSALPAKTGDLVSVNGTFYQLTGTDPVFFSDWANVGLKISTNFSYSSANELEFGTVGSSQTTNELTRLDIDQYGRVIGNASSIYDALTGKSTLNGNNSLSSIFNGIPSHSLGGGIPGLTITKFEAVSSNGISSTTLTLSSAGFITFEGGIQTRTGKDVGRFAIPIFTF
jgi:hypothetical protein